MRMKPGKKRIFVCLLLCSLFLTAYISLLNPGGISFFEANVSDVSSGSGGSGHASMHGTTNLGHFSLMSAIVSVAEILNLPSIKHSRPLVPKTASDWLTALITAQIVCLIYSSRLSQRICTQFNSIRITFFLHKKDGMK